MGGRIRRALPASTRNQLWLTGLFLALLALFMMTGARAFLAWPMYESLLSTLPLYGFLALGLTLVVAAGEMDLCFPSTLAVAGFGFALTAIHTGQVWLGVIVAILIGLGIRSLQRLSGRVCRRAVHHSDHRDAVFLARRCHAAEPGTRTRTGGSGGKPHA